MGLDLGKEMPLRGSWRRRVLLIFRSRWAFLLGMLCMAIDGQPLTAQDEPRVFPGTRPPEILPAFPEEKPPDLWTPRPPPAPSPDSVPGDRALPSVFVREIRVEGNSVLGAEELAPVTEPYTHRRLTALDLESLRRALTLHYIQKGYVSSGALLPDQEVVDGVVTFRIVEGQLTDIVIEGNRWLRSDYLTDRIRPGTGPPLNINDLQERMRILQQDRNIQRLHGELRPGAALGESGLTVRVDESSPVTATLGFNNYQSTSVGAERGLATLTHHSLTGHGDTLSFTYGRSEGADPQIDALYSLPLNARDTTLTLRYRKNDTANVREPFNLLDTESESDIFEAALRHPLYRSERQEAALGLAAEHLRNRTSLLGEPFSFSEGVRDGRSAVTALRFIQEWLYRTRNQVLAARSRFSLGLDILGATNNPPPLPDGQFLSWLGQFQWARIWPLHDIQTIFRTDLQLSGDPLLALEQIPVGGRYSVRGYLENLLVRDNALMASLEARIPLLQNRPWAEVLQLAPFVDFGTAWSTDAPTPDPRTIASVGLGLRWSATAVSQPFPLRPEFEIYWGYQLKDVETEGGSLQDHGVHFQILLHAF
jgi:hemolysin activation/secretion protein